MALAAHPVEVYVKNVVTAPTNPTDLVDGINKASYNLKRDLLDTTTFKDTTGFRLRLAALRDIDITISGDLTPGDAVQTVLKTAFDAGSSVWVSIYFNPTAGAGSKGFKVECLVESLSYDASFDGKVTIAYALKATGAPVVDP